MKDRLLLSSPLASDPLPSSPSLLILFPTPSLHVLIDGLYSSTLIFPPSVFPPQLPSPCPKLFYTKHKKERKKEIQKTFLNLTVGLHLKNKHLITGIQLLGSLGHTVTHNSSQQMFLGFGGGRVAGGVRFRV